MSVSFVPLRVVGEDDNLQAAGQQTPMKQVMLQQRLEIQIYGFIPVTFTETVCWIWYHFQHWKCHTTEVSHIYQLFWVHQYQPLYSTSDWPSLAGYQPENSTLASLQELKNIASLTMCPITISRLEKYARWNMVLSIMYFWGNIFSKKNISTWFMVAEPSSGRELGFLYFPITLHHTHNMFGHNRTPSNLEIGGRGVKVIFCFSGDVINNNK